MTKRKTAILKWSGLAIITLGILYSILLGLASRSLSQEYAALEADGRPMKAAEIIPPKIPDSENAAIVYKAVTLQLQAEPAGAKNLFAELADLSEKILRETPDTEAAERFRQLSRTAVFTRALKDLETGTRKAGARYFTDADYIDGPIREVLQNDDMRDLTHILGATAVIQASDGDAAAAWDTIITGLRYANALEADPILLSQVIRQSLFNKMIHVIELLVPIALPPEAQNQEILTLLSGFETMDPYIRALDGERLLCGEKIFSDPQLITEGMGRLSASIKPLVIREHAAYLGIMIGLSRNARLPFYSSGRTVDEKLIRDIPWYCFLVKSTAGALLNLQASFVISTAQAKVARAGLATLQYQRENGSMPVDLKDLETPNFVDPFSGKGLIYKTTPTGFIIYSIGENMIDDSGTSSGEKSGDDIVWSYPAE